MLCHVICRVYLHSTDMSTIFQAVQNYFRIVLQNTSIFLSLRHEEVTLNFSHGDSESDVQKHTTHLYNHFPDWKCPVVAFKTLCLVLTEWVQSHNISNREKRPFIRCLSRISGNHLHYTTMHVVAIYPPDCCIHNKVTKFDCIVVETYIHSGLYIGTVRQLT